jgi:FtsP/CotA-like multicopper oxidase with cupredoxin domain
MPGSSSGLIVFRISSRVGPARWLLHGDNIPRSSLKLAIGGLVGLATFFDLGSETARSQAPNELVQLPVCSADKAVSDALKGICEVTTLPSGRNRVQVNLAARTEKIEVGGYGVVTENYNGSYLSPVAEAIPGDTVAARLENQLRPREPSDGHSHGPAAENPTNLHYFHGGIVTPNNARPPDDASKGNGDNIYVYLKRSDTPFTYDVPIPHELDARVLEQTGVIPHPNGLNWYHSHLHGRSSDQVMGGLSGLLSVGDAKANVVACKPNPADPTKCLNDVDANTELKARTDVRYALLRDIALKNITALPIAAGDKSADWAPEDKDWKQKLGECKVWLGAGGQGIEDAKHRLGYCQREESKAWLFTLNGQRFPTITVDGGRNVLLRLGNLSANVVYWLELQNKDDETDILPLTLLSVDGVVPSKPVDVTAPDLPVRAFPVKDLLLMPASRAEIYVRNDWRHPEPKTYVLRTKGLIAGEDNELNDRWPEIQLAQIVLNPNAAASEIGVALNTVAARARPFAASPESVPPVARLPDGCVSDLDPEKGEHRRVTFFDSGTTSAGRETAWSILTEIVGPPPGATSTSPAKESNFIVDPDKTVGIDEGNNQVRPIPFEEYDAGDGKIHWQKKHVCIFIDPNDREHKGSHKQLWVLRNRTSALHNFHIHQMKFRLATAKELNDHKIDLTAELPSTCREPTAGCTDYKLYDEGAAGELTKWHDTIPVPPQKRVYLIMSFDAPEQIGRFVFHCHILKHEDNGLMAPIEVWAPTPGGVR